MLDENGEVELRRIGEEEKMVHVKWAMLNGQ
jgi:hypothetical protein